MPQIPQKQGGNARLFGNFQELPEFSLVPVPPDPGQDGLPLAGKGREGPHVRDLLQREGDGGGGEGQQLRRELPPGMERHGEGRGTGVPALVGDGFLIGQLPALRRGTAGLRQGGEGLAAKLVDGAGREGQALRHGHLDRLAAVGGAAGLPEPGFQLLRREGAGAGGLRNGSGDGDAVAVAVLGREGTGLPGGDAAGEGHRERPGAVFLVDRPGLGEELLGLRGVLRPGAEHFGAPAALPVGVREALAGEGGLEGLFLLRRGAAIFPQKPGVDARHHGHVLRPLHPALQLQTGDAHVLGAAQFPCEAAVLQRERTAPLGGGVQAVGQAAGLGAGPPAATAAADEGAEVALAGVAHAVGPVGEDLDLGGAVPADGLGVPGGALPGDDHPLAAETGGLLGAAGGEEAHLGAGVEGEVRQGLP